MSDPSIATMARLDPREALIGKLLQASTVANGMPVSAGVFIAHDGDVRSTALAIPDLLAAAQMLRLDGMEAERRARNATDPESLEEWPAGALLK